MEGESEGRKTVLHEPGEAGEVCKSAASGGGGSKQKFVFRVLAGIYVEARGASRLLLVMKWENRQRGGNLKLTEHKDGN